MFISEVRDDKRTEGKPSKMSRNEGICRRLQENLKREGCNKVLNLFFIVPRNLFR